MASDVKVVNTNKGAIMLGRRLRTYLSVDGLLVAPGVFDGLSARIAEKAGFEAVYASGGAIARAAGVPDLGLLTMSEVLARVGEIVRAVSVPVIADGDTGYGNALNAYRAVREFERIGVAALHLEDQVTPKRCGHYMDQELVPAEEMVLKLRSAMEARTDSDLVLIARTDARSAAGLDEAIRRAGLYANAGVDAIFVEAPQSIEELAEIPRRIQAPLVVNMFHGGRTPLVPAQQLAQMGYRIMLAPSDLQRAAMFAMQEAARLLRNDGSTTALQDRMITFRERDALVGLPAWQALENRYVLGKDSDLPHELSTDAERNSS